MFTATTQEMKMKKKETSGLISIQNVADDVALKQTTITWSHESFIVSSGTIFLLFQLLDGVN